MTRRPRRSSCRRPPRAAVVVSGGADESTPTGAVYRSLDPLQQALVRWLVDIIAADINAGVSPLNPSEKVTQKITRGRKS